MQVSPFNMTDNRSVYFWYDDIYAPTADAQTFTNWYAVDTTGIIRTYGDSSYNNTTDVIIKDEDYVDGQVCDIAWFNPTTMLGFIANTTCVRLNSIAACEQFIIRYEAQYVYIATPQQRTSNSCHETGHVLGVKHRWAPRSENLSRDHRCMETAPSVGSFYSAHDVGHFHDIFP